LRCDISLYDVAALTSGYEIEDSGDFAQRILSMMTSKSKTDIRDAEVETQHVEQELVEGTTASPVEKETFQRSLLSAQLANNGKTTN
jgi:hypothetical protein